MNLIVLAFVFNFILNNNIFIIIILVVSKQSSSVRFGKPPHFRCLLYRHYNLLYFVVINVARNEHVELDPHCILDY